MLDGHDDGFYDRAHFKCVRSSSEPRLWSHCIPADVQFRLHGLPESEQKYDAPIDISLDVHFVASILHAR
jgi:hypothetical protein